ncbi:MAG TPA: class I SAM-dependent methyltransferase [Chitinophagaceae bacterium]|jgi:SAM-dependent methyltransferase|nr:class I SAM-dependent methyltransferase [Chitinophagaceae bacterium]
MELTANINSTFFSGMYQDVWRKLIPAGLSEAEVDLMMDAANLRPGSRVLDFMCGYGRHALELGRRGVNVTAVDNEHNYIREIGEKAAAARLPVEAQVADAASMTLTGTYDLAVCMGNSFAFFDRPAAAAILANISRHLQPGGKLIINTWMIAEIALKHFRDKEWFYVEGYKYLMDHKFLFHPSRIESDHILIREDGVSEHLKGVDYILTLDELSSLFAETGIRMEAVYSTPRKRPFHFGDTRAYILAEKRV